MPKNTPNSRRGQLAVALISVITLLTSLPAHSQNAILTGDAGVSVTQTDIEATAQRIPLPSRQSVMSRPQNIARQAEDIYVRRVLAQEAVKAGRDKDPVVQAILKQAQERILSDLQLAAIEQAARPSDDAIAAFARETYKSAPQRFQAPAQTRARHILIAKSEDGKERERAQQLLDQIKKGASFEQLAATYSVDHATAAKGGDLGFYTAGSMVQPFEDAINQLKNPGDVSGLIETQFGVHIAKLEARRPAGVRPYEEVKDALEQDVRVKAQVDARQAYVETLVKGMKLDEQALEALAKQYGTKKP